MPVRPGYHRARLDLVSRQGGREHRRCDLSRPHHVNRTIDYGAEDAMLKPHDQRYVRPWFDRLIVAFGRAPRRKPNPRRGLG